MKPTLSALAAREHLEREFARRRPAGCGKCVAPAPFWGPAVASGSGYWYLRALPPCPGECRQVLAQVWAALTTEFEIERPMGNGRPARRGTPPQKKARISA